MYILLAAVVVAAVLFVYYKVAILKTKDSLTQRYFNAKSRICLGAFVFFFGINQYVAISIKVILAISIIFVILGAYQMYDGIKETRHYRKEWKRLHPDEA